MRNDEKHSDSGRLTILLDGDGAEEIVLSKEQQYLNPNDPLIRTQLRISSRYATSYVTFYDHVPRRYNGKSIALVTAFKTKKGIRTQHQTLSSKGLPVLNTSFKTYVPGKDQSGRPVHA